MPRLNDATLDTHKIKGNNYGYSATKMDVLADGASEYTLVTIVVDTSSSVGGFSKELTNSLKEVIKSCKYSPRADYLLVRVVTFASQMQEYHGFKLLEQCNLDDYDNAINCGGMTALYDASANAIQASSDYAKQLADNDFSINGVIIVITDGENNSSALEAKDVKAAMNQALKKETMESLVSVLIGVGVDPSTSSYLKDFKDEAGFTQYVEIKDANARSLAKLAAFVSKSISSQSQALGTGGPSQQISLTI